MGSRKVIPVFLAAGILWWILRGRETPKKKKTKPAKGFGRWLTEAMGPKAVRYRDRRGREVLRVEHARKRRWYRPVVTHTYWTPPKGSKGRR